LIAGLEVATVAPVTVRNLDDRVKERLRIRAATDGRSMESEIRAILTDAVRGPGDMDGLFTTMLDRFASLGGVDLDLPERSTPVRAPDLSA
jgi:plasmid stability protein